MRASGDDLVPDPVLESRHHGEHDDQGADTEEDASHADPGEERQVRPLPAGPEISQPQEELERQSLPHRSVPPSSAARPPSGPSKGTRTTSRREGRLPK